MRRAVKILAIIAALVLAGFVAYSLIYPTISVRYRLTLDVASPSRNPFGQHENNKPASVIAADSSETVVGDRLSSAAASACETEPGRGPSKKSPIGDFNGGLRCGRFASFAATMARCLSSKCRRRRLRLTTFESTLG
jgi:hypothetical protein